MPRCQQEMRAEGVAYPRTCPLCGLGPCQRGLTTSAEPLTLSGIGRDEQAPRGAALTLYFNRRPTDDEMRGVLDAARSLINGG